MESKKITWVKIQFDRWHCSTDKAVLLEWRNKEFWLPKWMARNLIINKKLGGNCSIPSFKFEELFGKIEDLNPEITMLIETHIPERVEPIQNRFIKELER